MSVVRALPIPVFYLPISLKTVSDWQQTKKIGKSRQLLVGGGFGTYARRLNANYPRKSGGGPKAGKAREAPEPDQGGTGKGPREGRRPKGQVGPHPPPPLGTQKGKWDPGRHGKRVQRRGSRDQRR